MDQYKVDCIVIGAGVIGLAVARRLALSGREVMILERESSIGSQTSSRNSEVIHAGIYYPKDSLKAKLCVKGKEILYRYCEERHIPFQRCGKMIVATDQEQVPQLQLIRAKAELNGVSDLQYLSKKEVEALESEVNGISALYSPSTGVLDSHSYMLQLQADFEAHGGVCVFNSEIQIIREVNNGLELMLNSGEALITANCCINAAGLDALPLFQSYSKTLDSASAYVDSKAYFAKGSYFSYSGAVPFRHLIYPIPEPGGLGIHLTLDMQGRAKFGPDVEWLSVSDPKYIDYTVDPSKKETFYQAVKNYWPSVDRNKMHADYSGVRPKLTGPGNPGADFLIEGPKEHGVNGLINLVGIESPGLTSSMAIAEYVESTIKASNL